LGLKEACPFRCGSARISPLPVQQEFRYEGPLPGPPDGAMSAWLDERVVLPGSRPSDWPAGRPRRTTPRPAPPEAGSRWSIRARRLAGTSRTPTRRDPAIAHEADVKKALAGDRAFMVERPPCWEARDRPHPHRRRAQKVVVVADKES